MSHRLVELAVPKNRKFADGTYDTKWGSQNPIRRIASATLTYEPSDRILELAEPKKDQTKQYVIILINFNEIISKL